MRNKFLFLATTLLIIIVAPSAKAEFIISSAIVEFTSDGPQQQDVELVSRSKDNDYIVTEVSEIKNAGTKNESRELVEDPASGMLLVTPDKTILSAGGRKLLRFMLLKAPDAVEHIYRVAIKPVIKGVDNKSKIGLKVLIGYEVLVIVRPANAVATYNAARQGNVLTITNTGNTNVLFQNGKQCLKDNCVMPQVVRVYPGQTNQVPLKFDQPVSYSVWDGKETIEKSF